MNIEKMKAFAQAQRESEESTEIRLPRSQPNRNTSRKLSTFLSRMMSRPKCLTTGSPAGLHRRRTGNRNHRRNHRKVLPGG